MIVVYILIVWMPAWQNVIGIGSLGKIFMISPPRLRLALNDDVAHLKFYLSTFATDKFEVIFSLQHGTKMGLISEQFLIQRKRIAEYVPDASTLTDEEMGHTWTFRFVGRELFGVTVVMLNTLRGAATFQALPTDAWGTSYYVVCGISMPFMQVTSDGDDNKVEVTLVVYMGRASFSLDTTVYHGGERIRFTLKRWESFSISNCSHGRDLKNTEAILDGTTVTADTRIGVVSGSCWTHIPGTDCDRDSNIRDMTAEMLFPREIYQRRLMFPNIPKRKIPAVSTFIAPPVDNKGDPALNITSSLRQHPVFFSMQSGMPYTYMAFPGNYYIFSDRGVLVVYLQTSSCYGKKWEDIDAGPNLCMVIPTRFYQDDYIWRTPELDTKNFVLMIVKLNSISFLMYDGQAIQVSIEWIDVIGVANYSVGSTEATKGDHSLSSRTHSPFGCYLYGFGKNSSYMHFAGFLENTNATEEDYADDLVDDENDEVDPKNKNPENKKDIPKATYSILLLLLIPVGLFYLGNKRRLQTQANSPAEDPAQDMESDDDSSYSNVLDDSSSVDAPQRRGKHVELSTTVTSEGESLSSMQTKKHMIQSKSTMTTSSEMIYHH